MAKVDVKDDHRICVRCIYIYIFSNPSSFPPGHPDSQGAKAWSCWRCPENATGYWDCPADSIFCWLRMDWNCKACHEDLSWTAYLKGFTVIVLACMIFVRPGAWGLMNCVFFSGNEFRPQRLHGTNPNRMTSQSRQTQVISQIHALLCKTKCCSPVWGGVSGHHWTVIMHSLLNRGTNSRMILLLTRGSTKISDCVLGVSHAISQLRQLQGWILRGEFLHWGFTRKGTVSRHAKTCWEAFYSTSIQAFMNVKPGTWGCTMVHFSLAWICLLTIKLSKIWIISLRERWSDSE